MATIIDLPLGRLKAKKHSIKVDMTPMVDLGFLLITFFIFTTALMRPTVTKLLMPVEGPPVDVPEKTLLTAILDKDKVLVYEGALDKALAAGRLIHTDYNVQTGLGDFIRQKQKSLQASGQTNELMVAIKPLPTASYQQVINALDEMLINNVKRYGLINLSPEEKKLAGF
jgi:biopolymer transport protein ExbD